MIVWLWKNGPVSADSTTGGLLNSSSSRCPKGGGRSSVLPNEPNTVRSCPKPPSRGKPSASASGVSLTFVATPMLKPRGLPSRSRESRRLRVERHAGRAPAIEVTAIAVLVAGFEKVSAVQVQRLAGAGQRAFQLQRGKVEVLLATEWKLIRDERIQFLIGRHAEIEARHAAQRLGCVLHDCDEREVAKRCAVVAPAQALWRIRIAPVGAEVDEKARVLGRRRVTERLHVLRRAEHQSSLWVESVRVHENQSKAPHQIRVFQRRQRRIGLGHEQRIAGRQGGNELRVDGEVVALHVTRPARPSVAIEGLVQEEPAALSDKLRKVGCSGGRGRGVETECRRVVIQEANLPVAETIEQGAGARQHE